MGRRRRSRFADITGHNALGHDAAGAGSRHDAAHRPRPKGAPHREAAYALINFLLKPEVNAKEALFHGYPVPDARLNALLPAEVLNDPILYPAADLLDALEFGAAATLTDPNRAELMARFKSA